MLISKLLDLNLEYYFREEVFSNVWNEEYNYELEMQNFPLTLSESVDLGISKEQHKLYIAEGCRNWIYKNDPKYNVSIYNNMQLVDPSNYSVNYIDGYIIFNDNYASNLTDIDLITANFWYLYVNVINSYPEEIENSPSNYRLPLLIIEGLPFRYEPFEIGNAKGIFRRQYLFHILATNESELDTLLNIIMENILREWALIDYSNGTPLTETGDKNLSFVKNEIGRIVFSDIRSDIIRERSDIQIMKHWGYINCAVNAYF